MTGISEQNRDLLEGAIDLFTHAHPDRQPRQYDDFELAAVAAAAGLRSVVHRHAYVSTAERARLVRIATGFDMLGAVILNDTLGGINPYAAEHALDMGAALVGLPTMSAAAYRADLGRRLPPQMHERLTFGPGNLTARDADGVVREEVKDVLAITRDRDAVLNLGYISLEEQLIVADLASRMGLRKIVVTDPFVSTAGLDALLAIEGLYVELETCSQLPGSPLLIDPGGFPFFLDVLRRAGIDRVVLSSDGGGAGSSPPEQLAWALDGLRAAGVAETGLRRLVHDNPLRLIGNFLDEP